MSAAAPPVRTPSQQRWLAVRAHLQRHRHALAEAAGELYPDLLRVADTPLLSSPGWLLRQPISLEGIELSWLRNPPAPVITGSEFATPQRPDGTTYGTYSRVVAELAAPSVFEDRSTYRLGLADLSGVPRLGFSAGTYFDGIDVGEAAAHEFAAADLEPGAGMPLRDAVADPCNPSRRPVNVALSCLMIRHEMIGRHGARHGGAGSFPLHWRDPAKVGHAGGLYQVMPVGIFQASSEKPGNQENDFSLWRCLVRESEEELLGADENHSLDGAPIDYKSWSFAVRMTAARNAGSIRAYCLGLGVDPLTFATDLLVALVVEADVYDDLFQEVVEINAEGRSLTVAEGAGIGGRITFDEESVRHFSSDVPMQAAGAAVLRLAWQHRATLLGR